jgi:protein O-mannosyl-transferase
MININPQRQFLIVYVTLAIVTLAVFWQVTRYDFVSLDDGVYVTENRVIQSGITLDGFRWAFSTAYAEFWHPLTWISLMFDYQLYGLNAGWYHLINLILHMMSVLLLFWLFNRMTGALWSSAFVAALFALHPLHVQSVAWIAERKDVLSAFFWMLTLCLYVYYTEKPVIRRYLLVLFFFVCGLMSKPMVVTLPMVMILLDYWPLGRLQFNNQKLSETKIAGIIPLWQLREKMPFFIVSAVFSIIAFYAQYKPLAKNLPIGSRIANALVSLMIYLEKTFWPHDLAVSYSYLGQFPAWQVLGAASLILVISVAVIAAAKRLPYLFVGWQWYAITLLPVIGIVQVNIPIIADHYTYLPSIGIFIMLAWGVPPLFQREDLRKKILFPAGIAVLVIMAVLTWQQCGYWKNSITLWHHALQVSKDNYIMHHNLASALLGGGRYEEAVDHLNKAIRLKPDYAEAYNNRGVAYTNLGQYKLAIEDYNKAISLNPNNALAYNNRGFIYGKLIQYQQAIEDYNEAIRLRPDYVRAYYDRGVAYLKQGNTEMGCRDAQKACAKGACKALEWAKYKGLCR